MQRSNFHKRLAPLYSLLYSVFILANSHTANNLIKCQDNTVSMTTYTIYCTWND